MAGLRSIGGGGGQLGTFGGLTMTGDRELDAMLKALPERVHKRVMGKAIKKLGKPIIKGMRNDLKGKHGGNTGKLVKSIGSKFKRYNRTLTNVLIIGPRKTFIVRAVPIKKDDGTIRIAYPKIPPRAGAYAIGIERGWRNRTPDPFMRRAFYKAGLTILIDYRRAIGNSIEKEAQKLAGKRSTKRVKR